MSRKSFPTLALLLPIAFPQSQHLKYMRIINLGWVWRYYLRKTWMKWVIAACSLGFYRSSSTILVPFYYSSSSSSYSLGDSLTVLFEALPYEEMLTLYQPKQKRVKCSPSQCRQPETPYKAIFIMNVPKDIYQPEYSLVAVFLTLPHTSSNLLLHLSFKYSWRDLLRFYALFQQQTILVSDSYWDYRKVSSLEYLSYQKARSVKGAAYVFISGQSLISRTITYLSILRFHAARSSTSNTFFSAWFDDSDTSPSRTVLMPASCYMNSSISPALTVLKQTFQQQPIISAGWCRSIVRRLSILLRISAILQILSRSCDFTFDITMMLRSIASSNAPLLTCYCTNIMLGLSPNTRYMQFFRMATSFLIIQSNRT